MVWCLSWKTLQNKWGPLIVSFYPILKYLIFKEFHYSLRVMERSVVVIPAIRYNYQPSELM
jgi:hypothetical protein